MTSRRDILGWAAAAIGATTLPPAARAQRPAVRAYGAPRRRGHKTSHGLLVTERERVTRDLLEWLAA